MTKTKFVAAVIFTAQSAGSIVGSFVPMDSDTRPQAQGHWSSLAMYCAVLGLSQITRLHLGSLNSSSRDGHYSSKAHKEDDYGLDVARDAERVKMAMDDGEDEMGVPYFFKARVFEDLTDLQDEEFVFEL